MRIAASLILITALGACDGPAPAPPPAPEKVASASGSTLPTADAAPRYVGTWAAAEIGCGHAAWRFQPRTLSTAGEVSCTFDTVTRTANGYDLAGMCQAQAPPEPHRLKLTFTESAKAMTLEGGPFAGPVSLTYCGPG